MSAILGLLSNPISTLIDRLVPDKAANEAAKNQMAAMALSGELANVAGQIQVNIAEASNPNMFVSGWRPFVGWVCGCGLAYSFLVMPIGNATAAVFHHPGIFPALDVQTLLTCLGGMLGLGISRTVEKMGGVASK
jgi:hypothetical protein